MNVNVADLRQEYTRDGLEDDKMLENPIEQFEIWFDQAVKATILEPNAMVLGTTDLHGYSAQRTVLMKAFDQQGFVFYTNYNSRKAKQILENSKVSLLFPWYALERQVIIKGEAEKVSTRESLQYFTTRPHGSKLGAWVSNQSSIITSRKILEMKLDEIKRKFADGKIPLPDFWGGFRVKPLSIEFWQGRPNRLHDRIEYQLDEAKAWTRHRLAP